jgi:hypothetical protein
MLTLENEAAYLKYWEEKGFWSAAEEEQLDVEIDEQLELEELDDNDSEAEAKVSGKKRQRDADSSDAKPAVKRRKLAGQHDHDNDSEAEAKVSGTKRQRDVSEDTGTPAAHRVPQVSFFFSLMIMHSISCTGDCVPTKVHYEKRLRPTVVTVTVR